MNENNNDRVVENICVWMTRPHSTVEKCTTGMACQTRHLQAFEKLKTGVLQRSAVKGL